MTAAQAGDLARLEAKAGEAAAFLRLLGNDKRLLTLCQLLLGGETEAMRLADTVGLSPSAMSQHLARLRADGLVATRREGATIHYRLADDRVAPLISTLKDIFCPDE